MIRLGMTLGVREDKIDEYKRLHANVWPEILDNLTELDFKNFSIYLMAFSGMGFVERFFLKVNCVYLNVSKSFLK